MKSFLTIACVLLAVATVCSAQDTDADDRRTSCAVRTFDSVKERALELIEEYREQLDNLRGNYTACNALPTGGEREQCHLEYGRHVVQVLLALRPRLDEIKTNVLRFGLSQLDLYFNCRTLRDLEEINDTVCAVLTYERTRQALAPFLEKSTPRVEALREAITKCYYSPEAQKATCYYRLLETVRVEIAEVAAHLTQMRPVLVGGAVDLLDGYYTCRIEN